MGLIPGLGRSLGEGNGNPLQYSCLGNPTDRAACQATVQGIAESDTTEHTHMHTPKCSPMKFCYYLVAKPCIKLAYILWVIDYLKMNAAFIFSDFLVEKFLI